jgi:DivIVA domain-containing protein
VILHTRFDFAVPPDVAWEVVKAALAPMGGVVTSEDFRTLLIERRSPVDVVEFKLAMRPGATDETSVLVVDEASVLVGDPRGWEVMESLYVELLHVILGLDYLRDPLVSRLRAERFRRALKGYNVDEVDELLEALAARRERGEALFPEDVISNGFRISWKGYHKQDVDDFLERIAAAIDTQSH